VAIAQKTASDAITFAETPEFGHGEVADRPMAAPKARSTKVIAAARTAPASTAPHSTKLAPPVDEALTLSGAGPTCVMAFCLPTTWLVKPEEAQDEQDDDD
jgi:hypothetical protein